MLIAAIWLVHTDTMPRIILTKFGNDNGQRTIKQLSLLTLGQHLFKSSAIMANNYYYYHIRLMAFFPGQPR